jgi:predicted membrane channel-forming protein YqfA (hemolysin III family)
VTLRRSLSAAAFGVVILGVLVAIAGLGLFVAVQTLRDRRKFQPPMTTWYAAMLFAVVPLRNALPGSPPFGGWVDVTIVLWVLVVLVISMLLYIACWWKHLRPEAEQPTNLAVSPEPPAASPTPS